MVHPAMIAAFANIDCRLTFSQHILMKNSQDAYAIKHAIG
jgi:hypothetical protein